MTAKITEDDSPPNLVIRAAIVEAQWSPCAKSKRGVAVWSVISFERCASPFRGRGHNSPPRGFGCDGSEACRAACNRRCEHAEAAALRRARWTDERLEMLHVKVVDKLLVESGGPSCVPCAAMIRADQRVNAMWLYHGPDKLGASSSGWRRYETDEFYRLSCEAQGVPVIEFQAGLE